VTQQAATCVAAHNRLPPRLAVGDNAAMPTEPPKADPPKRKRRWFQFSLRSLMIFTLICAIPCAWLGRKIEQKRREREAVQAIVELHGRVQYDYERAGAKPAGPDWLRNLLGENFFNEVEVVDCAGIKVTEMTDAGLENLKSLPKLQVLLLEGTPVTDVGLASIRGLTHLQELDLAETNVSDAGLENLKGLVQLQSLGLSETQVSDNGLANLKGLTKLQVLRVSGPNVTDAGVNKLQKALPNCKIDR
jgi:Leucine-rich repeat (LRR) protein